MNKLPPTDLTVNTVKISREAFRDKLVSLGYKVACSDFSPISVRIEGSVDVTRLPGYDEGEFFVQDLASSTAASVLGARSGELLIDVSACPGGKTFASAILMQDGGEIFSFDVHESKLPLIEDGAARLGLNSVKVSVCDATSPREELFGKADRVICDTVCSGLGVIAKKPDMRYKSEDGTDALPELQYSILNSSAKYLKVGGRLLYSTCTVTNEENSCVVDRFLAENKNFRAVDFNVGEYRSENGCFTFIPHIHSTDGFFVCLIEREA
jgi:16S rRNA (cytosine967-C5)-methyltransferase